MKSKKGMTSLSQTHLHFQQIQLLAVEHFGAGLGLRLHAATSRNRSGQLFRRLHEQLLLLGKGGSVALELFLRIGRRGA
jgi:hypothetical protein